MPDPAYSLTLHGASAHSSPPDKPERVARFHRNTLKALEEMTGSPAWHIREKDRAMVTGQEVYPYLPKNFLVEQKADNFGYLERWHCSSAESFAPF